MDPLGSLPPTRPPARTTRPGPGEAGESPPGPGGDLFTPAVRPGRSNPAEEPPQELIHPGTAQEFRPTLEQVLDRLPWGLLQAIARQGYRLHVVDSLGHHPVTLELEPGEHPWRDQHISPAALELLTRPLRSNLAGMVYHGRVPGLRGEGLRIVLWDKVFRRGDGLADWYILHELGHCTDYCLAFQQPERWRDWSERVGSAFAARTAFLTRYAGESPTEYLAEGFAAWATPPGLKRTGQAREEMELERWDLDADILACEDPELFSLIEEAVSALC